MGFAVALAALLTIRFGALIQSGKWHGAIVAAIEIALVAILMRFYIIL